jgi:hypothetical protein
VLQQLTQCPIFHHAFMNWACWVRRVSNLPCKRAEAVYVSCLNWVAKGKPGPRGSGKQAKGKGTQPGAWRVPMVLYEMLVLCFWGIWCPAGDQPECTCSRVRPNSGAAASDNCLAIWYAYHSVTFGCGLLRYGPKQPRTPTNQSEAYGSAGLVLFCVRCPVGVVRTVPGE